MDPTNVRRAFTTLRLNRRSWKGGNSSKGFGKKIAHKAERRLGKALIGVRD